MSLAVQGNMAKVSTTAEQCQEKASYFSRFPPQAVVHAFGNVLKPDFDGSLHTMRYAYIFVRSETAGQVASLVYRT